MSDFACPGEGIRFNILYRIFRIGNTDPAVILPTLLSIPNLLICNKLAKRREVLS